MNQPFEAEENTVPQKLRKMELAQRSEGNAMIGRDLFYVDLCTSHAVITKLNTPTHLSNVKDIAAAASLLPSDSFLEVRHHNSRDCTLLSDVSSMYSA